MPVQTYTGLYRKMPEILNAVHELVDTEKGQLGIAYVGKGDERLLPEYPAVVVTSGPLNRSLHGTHTFLLTFFLECWVYHAKLTRSHSVRTIEDLELVDKVVDHLHEHMTLPREDGSKGIIQSWVESENPGFFNRPKGEVVVGTHIRWYGISQERFK